MIEKQQYELYDVNEGDDTVYDIGGFDPEIMLLKKMFTNLKKSSDRFIRRSRTIYGRKTR